MLNAAAQSTACKKHDEVLTIHEERRCLVDLRLKVNAEEIHKGVVNHISSHIEGYDPALQLVGICP